MNNLVSGQLFMFAAIFAIFYFVLIRPQQQQRKKHERALLTMKKGDEIVTSGGIVGDVIHIRATGADGAATMEDRVTIKSGESRLIVERGKVTRILSTGADDAKGGASASASS
jgi:preprotein translocase subunit YajC